ncbi:MAG: hypothetical protein QNJ18_09445 [Xenococcaceae cyanobacterium MO_167.B52]|nr:hypothetical protein [Xenococcaceae cyanobacterium MO_167.B52]
MSVELRAVTKENWIQCIKLKLAPEQESFVAPNVDSIAESKFELHYEPRAIYFFCIDFCERFEAIGTADDGDIIVQKQIDRLLS